MVQAAPDAATTERALLRAKIFHRGPVWRLHAVDQSDYGAEINP